MPVAPTIMPDAQILPVLQQTYDGASTLAMSELGGVIVAVFVIYAMFEFLLIILDRRRGRL